MDHSKLRCFTPPARDQGLGYATVSHRKSKKKLVLAEYDMTFVLIDRPILAGEVQDVANKDLTVN